MSASDGGMWAKSKGEYFEWMQFEGLLQASLMLSTVCSAPLTADAAVVAAFAMFVAVWARPVVAVGIAGKGQRRKMGGAKIPCRATSVIMAAAAIPCDCRAARDDEGIVDCRHGDGLRSLYGSRLAVAQPNVSR